jgi:SAM-dependent methyltransferase
MDVELELARFSVSQAMSHWSEIDAGASPARRLSDFFWLSLPWPRISAQLRGDVRLLEVGCGTGRYGLLLRKCLGESFTRYLGLDVESHPEWTRCESDTTINFVRSDVGAVEEYLEGNNLIITQSALEHFDEDLAFFRRVSEYVRKVSEPVIQVHLMPSAGCLTTFLWHGVRHYTPRTTSRITAEFASDTRKRLYFLGSARCNQIHRRYITYPWLFGRDDRRQGRIETYNRELHEAMRLDELMPRGNEACFHALVLQTRVERDIFSVADPLEGS